MKSTWKKEFPMAFLSATLVAGVLPSDFSNASGTTFNHGMYDFGKKLFFEKVVCSACLFPNENINSNDKLREVAQTLKRDGQIGKDLSIRDRNAIYYYLRARVEIEG